MQFFSYCSWGSQGKNTEVVCHSLLQWTTFCQTSPHDPPPWVALQAWLGFTELDKAVVLVWLDWLVFCEYGFSVSALGCPLATPTILLGFLLPWAWCISSQLLQQIAAAAPHFGQGVFPHRPSWPWTWTPLGPPAPAQPPLLGYGVAPLGRCPWPQTWGTGKWPCLGAKVNDSFK